MSDNEYKIIFSKNLKYYLDLNEKTQQDLVKDLGLSSSTVSNWYTGLKLPRMNKIEMLANYFGINKSDLLEKKSISKNESINLSKAESKLLLNFNKLNDLGKMEANKRIEELTQINKYSNEFTLAAHDDDLDPNIAKENLNKALRTFEKMDEE